MPYPTVTVKADLDSDGTYETDWSTYHVGFTWDLKRDTALDDFRPRRCQLRLDNTDGRFSPRNKNGPYYPNLVKGKRVQIQAQVTVAAMTNLLRNPSLEVDQSFFTAVGVATISRVEEAHYGRYGERATAPSAAVQGLKQNAGQGPGIGAQWSGSIFVKASASAAGKTITLKVSYNVDGLSASATFTLTEGWQRINVVGPIATGTNTDAEVEATWSAATGDYIDTDGWQLETGATILIYCDGDQPGCSWSGARHGSTSTRTANPTFNQFTGELREFRLERTDMLGIATFELTGISEGPLRTLISAGPFARDPANVILNRVMDIIDAKHSTSKGLAGGLLEDGAFRIGADAWVAHNGTTIDTTFDTGSGGDDPIVYAALEGDNVMRITGIDAQFEGAKIDVTAKTQTGKEYSLACGVKGVGGSIGKRVRIAGHTLQDQVTLTGDWQYIRTAGGSYATSPREIIVETVLDDWTTGGPFEFYVDIVHGVEVADFFNNHIIDFTTLGTKWGVDLEYLDAFHRSAGPLLRELAASVGGWFYENGAGSVVFEDYSQRDPAVISIPTLRLSDEAEGGFGFRLLSYNEPMGIGAGQVKVGSFGDVHALPAPSDAQAKIVWSLEPVPISLAANEQRTFFADHVSEDESVGGLIARRPQAVALPLGGWAVSSEGVQTPYAESYGRSSDVVIKDGGGAVAIARLLIGARVQHRQQTERVFHTQGSDEPTLEIEMPAQGDRTQIMQDVATWAFNKYNKGPAVVEVQLDGISTEKLLNIFGRSMGEPTWLHHKTGSGAFGLEGLFYIEGMTISYHEKEVPTLRLRLEEA